MIYFGKNPPKEKKISGDKFKDLNNWCIEHDYRAEQREELELSDLQSKIISRNRQKEEIKGCAGAGKTVILVGKACRAIKKNEKVKVLFLFLSSFQFSVQLSFFLKSLKGLITQSI